MDFTDIFRLPETVRAHQYKCCIFGLIFVGEE